MNKAVILLLLGSLLSPQLFAKGKKKREDREQIDTPDISAKPEQVIGRVPSRNDDHPGYSQSSSHKRFQEAFQVISEHADACRFSYNTMLALSLGGRAGMEDILGRAAAVGAVYNTFRSKIGDIDYSFDDETGTDCTLSKKRAKEDGKIHIDDKVFKWSPGVLMAVHTIGKALDEIGWNKVEVDGIHFTHVNANGSRIEDYNIGCSYKAKKSRLPWKDFNYYYEIKVDLGNHKTNLDIATIQDCLTNKPN